jgi:hypothetical protein
MAPGAPGASASVFLLHTPKPGPETAQPPPGLGVSPPPGVLASVGVAGKAHHPRSSTFCTARQDFLAPHAPGQVLFQTVVNNGLLTLLRRVDLVFFINKFNYFVLFKFYYVFSFDEIVLASVVKHSFYRQVIQHFSFRQVNFF